jgi:hypothetical protein
MIQTQSAENLIGALRFAAAHGLEQATKILDHPQLESPEFLEALRLTQSQLLVAPNTIESYAMPIKRGMSIDATVINPLLPEKTVEGRTKMVERYERFLQGNRIDIWVKRQNTLKFLAVAEAKVAEFAAGLGSGKYAAG